MFLQVFTVLIVTLLLTGKKIRLTGEPSAAHIKPFNYFHLFSQNISYDFYDYQLAMSATGLCLLVWRQPTGVNAFKLALFHQG